MTDAGIVGAVISDHAVGQFARRGIDELQVRRVLASPASVSQVRPGRVVVQGLVAFPPDDVEYLLRVIVDVDRVPPVVVTAYRTSNIAKYEPRP